MFYSRSRAQAHADFEVERQLEYESEQDLLRHVDSTVLEDRDPDWMNP